MTLSRSHVLGVCLLVVALATSVRGQTPITIEMQPLGSLGGASTEAYAINEAGHIVGESQTADGQTHGFVWTPAGMVGIPPLAGDQHSVAYLINNVGDVFGVSGADDGRPDRLIVWRDGTSTDGGSLGSLLFLADTNDRGHVVGYTYEFFGHNSERCVYWSAERLLEQIVPFPGATGCVLIAVSASGQAVGYAYNSDGRPRAFLYDYDTREVILPPIPDGEDYLSLATGINDLGHVILVIGRPVDDGTLEARTYLWSPPDSLVDIGLPAGSNGILGRAINNLDHIVGHAGFNGSTVAFRWSASDGLGLLPFDSSDTQVAVGVNDNGRIVGFTTHFDGSRFVASSFLWTEEAGLSSLDVPGAWRTTPGLIGHGINNAGDILANFVPTGSETTQAAVWRVRTRPPTPQEAIDAIADEVASLPDAGVSEGEANALLTKLDAALARLDKGKPKEAANVLDAFIHQVDAMVKSGRLSAAEGQALTQAARGLIAQLQP